VCIDEAREGKMAAVAGPNFPWSPDSVANGRVITCVHASSMLLLALLAALLPFAASLCYNPATVSQLNVQQYTGTWYQQAESKFVAETTERNITCSRAIYTLIPSNNTVSVWNQGRHNNLNGSIENIYGYAEIPDASYPGRLKVYLKGSFIPAIGAPYWILQLGPVTNNQYSWAIVSDPFCVSLFILTRAQVAAPQDIQTMQQYVQSVGFSLSDWVPMGQQGCVYDD